MYFEDLASQFYIKDSTNHKKLVKLLKNTHNDAIDLAIKNVSLTEFASEFLQEGASDAIEESSLTNLKV